MEKETAEFVKLRNNHKIREVSLMDNYHVHDLFCQN
jgi:hypothetical protein